MSSSNNQSFADAGLENRPLMLEKGSYVPWSSRFQRYIDGKKDYGNMLKDSILKEADLTGDDKKHFKANIDAMNAILLGIPNDIYNFVDACKTAQAMWQRVKRFMQGTDLSRQGLTSILLDEFEKFKEIIKNVGNTGRNMGRIVGNSGNAAFGQPTNGNNATVQRVPRISTTSGNTSTVKCYNCNEKDEARITLTKEENDFLLAEVDGEELLKELNASCIMMVRIQTVDKNSDAKPSYDSDLANEVHDSQTSLINDIFSKNMEGNSGNDEQDNNVHDQKNAEFVLLIWNVQLEAEKTNKAIKDVKEENALLQKELEKYKEQVRVLETKPENKYDYMKAYNES
ncbi:hypothetical protein Tco_0242815 [Tanacetum coccineum]